MCSIPPRRPIPRSSTAWPQLGGFGANASPSKTQRHTPTPTNPGLRLRPASPQRPYTAGRHWIPALAAALAVLLGGILFIWLGATRNEPEEHVIPAVVVQATPGTPANGGADPHRLLAATFNPASIGATDQAAWTTSLEYLLDIPTGETYRQNGPESGDTGISVVVVTKGTFDAVSSGPTLLYRSGEDTGQEIAPNTRFALSVGDAWIASMDDLATAANTGGAPAELLRSAIGKPGDGTYFEFTPSGGYPFAHDPKGPALPDGPVTVDLQRIPLEKGDSYGTEVRANESYLLVTSGTGAVRIAKDGSNRGASASATSLGDYPSGAYTIMRDLSGSVDLYLARWSSATVAIPDGSPSDVVPASATLLNATIDPAGLGIANQADWGYTGIFTKSGLHPGQTIVLDASNWGAGLTATSVIDGAISLVAQGAVAVQRAGDPQSRQIAPGEAVTLTAGDAVFFDGSHGVEISNPTDADASFLTFVAFEAPDQFFPDVPYPTNSWGPKAPLVDLDMSQQFAGPVVLTVQQFTIDREQPLYLEVGSNEVVFYSTDDGSALQFAQEGAGQPITSGTTVLHDKGPGRYTITRQSPDPSRFIGFHVQCLKMRVTSSPPHTYFRLHETLRQREAAMSRNIIAIALSLAVLTGIVLGQLSPWGRLVWGGRSSGHRSADWSWLDPLRRMNDYLENGSADPGFT